MTEEKARGYAKTLAQGIGITFYVVRSPEGRFLPVELPSDVELTRFGGHLST
jgi:hypothetical protein